MEKLQQALEKARERRQGTPPRTDRPGQGTGPRGGPRLDAVTAAWDALDEVRLDQKRLVQNRVLSMEAGRQATPFDIMRTKVQLMMQKNQWTRLAVTSPTPGCGKTTTACNLALGFTRQAGLRAILIELDLSRPMVAKILGFQPRHTIPDMLNGEASFADSAVRVRNNVAIAATHKSATDPTSVLLAQSTQDTLAQIEAVYAPDVVIFDLPPILASDETRAFLSNVDAALLMAKAESTTMAQIDFCEKEIAEYTNVMGMVLNQCRHVDELNSGYDGYYYKS